MKMKLSNYFKGRLAMPWSAWRQRSVFRGINTYCMFIGYPRSGHSLIGALLNAHSDMVIAHELDALNYLNRGFNKRGQIFELLLRRDKEFTDNGGRWGDYTYQVPNQWQGRFRSLKVIGDKKGGATARQLTDRPELLAKLRQTIRLPFRIIHAIRNPFDNIATITRRNDLPLEQAAEDYFKLAAANLNVLETNPKEEIMTLRHEDFIQNPKAQIKMLVEFIGLETDEKYLADCASIVHESPNKSRHKAQWNDALIESIQADIGKFPFFKGYTFAN